MGTADKASSWTTWIGKDFLKTLAEACQKTGWQVHVFCLMPNHYHLVVETPNANLVAGMAWLQSTYTIRLNHRRTGQTGDWPDVAVALA